MPVKNRIQLRRGTSTEWSGSVDILASGEMGWDTTENNIKIGDGSNYWDDLPWLIVAGVSGQVINPSIISGVSGIFLDTSVGDVDLIAGQFGWNSEAGTAEIGLTDDLKIQIGQTVLFRVKNSTGSTLSKGQAVYASGVLGGGQIIQAAPFAVDNSVPEVRFIGLVTDDILNGEDGYVSHFGHIKNVDLRSTNTTINPNGETWAVGDILFVDDTTAGGLTKVQPQDDIYVALVLADGQNGELFVRLTDPGHIGDLHDVNTSGLVDNNLMVWNSGSDYWEPTSDLYYVDGNVGIGTDTPSYKLQVEGTFRANNASSFKEEVEFLDTIAAGSLGSDTDDTVIILNGSNYLKTREIDARVWGTGLVDGTGNTNYISRWSDSNTITDSIIYQSASNIGIGTTNPTNKLEVNGSFSATTKSFLINHPTKKGKKLQYGSLESPYHGVRLTGRDSLKDGICIVKLPSYMKKLVKEDEINIQITNYKHAKTLYVDDIDIDKNCFVVKGHRCKTLGKLEFFWSFTAVRKDVPDLVVEK